MAGRFQSSTDWIAKQVDLSSSRKRLRPRGGSDCSCKSIVCTKNISRLFGAGRNGTEIVDAPLDRQGKHQASAIWLKQMIHPDGAPALTEFRVEKRFKKHGAVNHSSPGAS